ncbi:hypothetical protein [Pseudoclavibacter sp. RFBG4]|uniref:hypothetical protein n=1 Tax=Pseudoclavibacter sp. RFBG4 TaxID=2080575 RepID=UPI001CA4A8B0|nr:hypothetical protein [Pseudoclavibacter sp. RFBG4]
MTTTTLIRDEALARGTLGISALAMMRSVMTEQLPRFPGVRTTDSVDDFVSGFFEDKGTGYVNVITALPDDRAAKRETRKWVERWLIDLTRKQPWGALRNRIEKRLERSSFFSPSEVKHYWFLADGEDTDLQVTETALREIAASARVEISVATGDGSGALGSKGQLEEMLRRLLVEAGRLHVSELTRICADRFPSLLETGDVLTSATDADWDTVEETTPAVDSSEVTQIKVDDEEFAKRLMPQLTEVELAAIRHGGDAAALAIELGVGRTSAYNAVQKVRARLTELAGDSTRSQGVLAALLRLVLDDSPNVPSLHSEDKEDANVV